MVIGEGGLGLSFSVGPLLGLSLGPLVGPSLGPLLAFPRDHPRIRTHGLDDPP